MYDLSDIKAKYNIILHYNQLPATEAEKQITLYICLQKFAHEIKQDELWDNAHLRYPHIYVQCV